MRFICLIITLLISLNSFAQINYKNIEIKGEIECEGKGVSGVMVTDGRNTTVTNSKGRYVLESSTSQKFIYYTLPAGYESPIENGIPVFYKEINADELVQEADFTLAKDKKSQDKHGFIVWADPQTIKIEEIGMLKATVKDVNETINSYPSLSFNGICCGDIVFDRQNLFPDYKRVLEEMPIPFYQVIGNHDMDYNNRSNEGSSKGYNSSFGPEYYSFNRGKIHYVVLKDLFYYGHKYHYFGYIDEAQLRWLEFDLKSVKEGSTVVVSLHIPTLFNKFKKRPNHNAPTGGDVINNKELFRILEPYNTHILAGHSHTQWNTIVNSKLREHVHAAASGAWWQGDVCCDGTPNGYTVYLADGDSLSWYFKGVGKDKSDQLRLYEVGADTTQSEYAIVNVYNYDTNWKVYWYEDGVKMGEPERYFGFDPLARELYKPGKNKTYSWLSAGKTDHLFRFKPKSKGAKIMVEAIDCFGNSYKVDEVYKY